jgi:hypothetical protein
MSALAGILTSEGETKERAQKTEYIPRCSKVLPRKGLWFCHRGVYNSLLLIFA